MEITRPADAIGIPGRYVTDDPGAKDKAGQHGSLSLRFGLGWAKSHAARPGALAPGDPGHTKLLR
ncbi:glutathione-independent formaldehyde dehydrogenase [Burkholderia aenigmatica]|uniref:Glutathione-independent formaldehyde dehydrogenase n=1 Tax=Burkholderia aenigmatica TaxID=2015348 RepID=A0A6P2HPU1_9BURK|nr:glutathione-independent formaldehyde dehydrogenase [Burkholderia aenigmatica]